MEAAKTVSDQEVSHITMWCEGMEIEPGKIYSDLPNALYHKGPGISKSGLDLIHKSPLHFRTMRDNPKPSTPALETGSALHAAVLEPDLFLEKYIPDPTEGSRSKAAVEEREKLEKEGKILLGSKVDEESGIWGMGQYQKIIEMTKAVREHPTASILFDLSSGEAELSAYWVDDETKKLCKARADFYNRAHGIIVDLKSTPSAAMVDFSKSCANFRYHVQDAFYTDGYRAVGENIKAFVFVAVEKEPPFAVACYKIVAAGRDLGRTMYRHDLEVYKQCAERNEWPGYAWNETTPFGIRDIYLPAWASSQGVN